VMKSCVLAAWAHMLHFLAPPLTHFFLGAALRYSGSPSLLLPSLPSLSLGGINPAVADWPAGLVGCAGPSSSLSLPGGSIPAVPLWPATHYLRGISVSVTGSWVGTEGNDLEGSRTWGAALSHVLLFSLLICGLPLPTGILSLIPLAHDLWWPWSPGVAPPCYRGRRIGKSLAMKTGKSFRN
jgi:hypothetical protein